MVSSTKLFFSICGIGMIVVFLISMAYLDEQHTTIQSLSETIATYETRRTELLTEQQKLTTIQEQLLAQLAQQGQSSVAPQSPPATEQPATVTAPRPTPIITQPTPNIPKPISRPVRRTRAS